MEPVGRTMEQRPRWWQVPRPALRRLSVRARLPVAGCGIRSDGRGGGEAGCGG